MSELTQKIGFGAVNDTDESLKGKDVGAYGSFGLNQGFLTKFEYNPNGGKDESPADAVDITVKIGEREYRRRIYDVTRVYDKDNNELTDENDPNYIKIFNENMKQNMAVIVHTAKAVGVTQDQINNALKTPPTNFADWAKIITGLIPANFETRPLDVFLEYQWNIAEGQTKTYLELPKNMKGGYFLCPAQPGTWQEEKEWTVGEESFAGLRYVSGTNVHPFDRNASYMESNKAIQQVEGQQNTSSNTSIQKEAPKAKW